MTTTAAKRAPLVIPVSGRLILEHRQEFKALVCAELERGARSVVLDFAGSEYIDSSGVGVLVTLARTCRVNGVQLVLAGLNAETTDLLVKTQLAPLFTIATDVPSAVMQLEKSA
jgi:anti-sigma B factor antagonist